MMSIMSVNVVRGVPARTAILFAIGLMLTPAAPAQFYGGYQERWVACGKPYSSERQADKAIARCKTLEFSCEEVAAKGVVSLRKGRLPYAPRNYNGPWGVVVVEVEFNEAGQYASARIIRAPSDALAQLSMEAVETWEVDPSCPGGTPVRQTAKMPIQYRASK